MYLLCLLFIMLIIIVIIKSFMFSYSQGDDLSLKSYEKISKLK